MLSYRRSSHLRLDIRLRPRGEVRPLDATIQTRSVARALVAFAPECNAHHTVRCRMTPSHGACGVRGGRLVRPGFSNVARSNEAQERLRVGQRYDVSLIRFALHKRPRAGLRVPE
ncbi:hypothetical protein CERSUDRAFT_110105, partial [Gelatoporia subvermispora B]